MKRSTLLFAVLTLCWTMPMWAQESLANTNWSWTAPAPPLPGTEWYDYGWDSTSNGPTPAETRVEQAKVTPRFVPLPLLMTGFLPAPDSKAPEPAPVLEKGQFDAGRFSVSPFTGTTFAHTDPIDGRQFTGLGVGYHVARNIEVSGEAALTDTDERFIDNFGAFGRGYLPVWRTGFALYGELGWKRYTGDDDVDFLSTGAGVTFRGKHGGIRLGGRRLDDLNGLGLWEVLVAAEIGF